MLPGIKDIKMFYNAVMLDGILKKSFSHALNQLDDNWKTSPENVTSTWKKTFSSFWQKQFEIL